MIDQCLERRGSRTVAVQIANTDDYYAYPVVLQLEKDGFDPHLESPLYPLLCDRERRAGREALEVLIRSPASPRPRPTRYALEKAAPSSSMRVPGEGFVGPRARRPYSSGEIMTRGGRSCP